MSMKPPSKRGAKANKRRARLHKAAMERRKAAQNDPARITQPLTPKLLARETEAATKLQFGDQEREIQGEQRASDLHNQRIGGWFNEYQAKVREAQQRTAAVYGQQQASMQAASLQAGQQDNAQLQQLQGQGQADAANRGAVMDPGASAMAQQAIAARGTTNATQSNLVGSQGANQSAYLIDRERIGARSGIEERGKESSRRRTLDRNMREVQKDKGEFKVKYKSEARDKERKSQLEQMVFAGEMAQNQQKAEGDAAALRSSERKSSAERKSRERINRQDNRTSSRNSRRSSSTTRRGQDVSSRDRQSAEAGRNARDDGPAGKKGKPRYSAGDRTASRKKIAKVQDAGSQYKAIDRQARKEGEPLTPSEIRQLMSKRGFSTAEINAGNDIRVYGELSGPNYAALKRAGVLIPKKWRPKRKATRGGPSGTGRL